MLRGLEGRRVAVFVSPQPDASRVGIVGRALEQAGARIHILRESAARDEDFQGGSTRRSCLSEMTVADSIGRVAPVRRT